MLTLIPYSCNKGDGDSYPTWIERTGIFFSEMKSIISFACVRGFAGAAATIYADESSASRGEL